MVRDPEQRTTQTGVTVTNFTVAVNRRGQQQEGSPTADFFDVAAWRERGELCAKYLSKGKKVCVIGPVSVRTYQANDGTTKAQLEITADEVEFLSSRNEEQGTPTEQSAPAAEPVDIDSSELPF